MNILQNRIKGIEDGFRFRHTLSVLDECRKLADIYGLDDTDKRRLCCAALLHDVTKGYPNEKQLELCKKYSITLSADDIDSPATIHAITGAAVAKAEYSKYADNYVCDAIRTHTTGSPDMTLLQQLLYLADVIEPTRKYDDCKALREFFYRELEKGDIAKALDDAIIKSFQMTINLLQSRGMKVHSQTNNAYEYLKNRNNGNNQQ